MALNVGRRKMRRKVSEVAPAMSEVMAAVRIGPMASMTLRAIAMVPLQSSIAMMPAIMAVKLILWRWVGMRSSSIADYWASGLWR